MMKIDEAPRFRFSCRKCRNHLFGDDDLEQHSSEVKAYNTRSHDVRVSVLGSNGSCQAAGNAEC